VSAELRTVVPYQILGGTRSEEPPHAEHSKQEGLNLLSPAFPLHPNVPAMRNAAKVVGAP
jgi:hypothetical protein